VAAEPPQPAGVKTGDVFALEGDRPGRRFDQAQDTAPNGRFSRAGFTRQSQYFVRLYVETHVVDGFHMADDAWKDAAANFVPLAQIPDFEKGRRHDAEAPSSDHRTQRTM
jgi:hypothetical protein